MRRMAALALLGVGAVVAVFALAADVGGREADDDPLTKLAAADVIIALGLPAPGDIAAAVAADAAADGTTTVPPRPVVLSTEPPIAMPEPTGSHVTPDDLGVSVGAIGPTTTIEGDLAFITDDEILEDAVVEGCVTIEADRVTLRNVVVNCGSTYPIKDTATTGTRLQNVTVDCLDDPRTRKGMFFDRSVDFGVDRVEVRNCDDQFFLDGGLGTSWITNSVFHRQHAATQAHTDGAQIGTFETTGGTLVVDGNWWEYDREGCCDNAVIFASSSSTLTVEVRHNWLDGDFGVHLVRCSGESTCNVVGNVVNGRPSGLVVEHGSPFGGTAGCNRFTTGALVPRDLYAGVTVDDQSC